MQVVFRYCTGVDTFLVQGLEESFLCRYFSGGELECQTKECPLSGAGMILSNGHSFYCLVVYVIQFASLIILRRLGALSPRVLSIIHSIIPHFVRIILRPLECTTCCLVYPFISFSLVSLGLYCDRQDTLWEVLAYVLGQRIRQISSSINPLSRYGQASSQAFMQRLACRSPNTRRWEISYTVMTGRVEKI